jgi:hypothetical protein
MGLRVRLLLETGCTPIMAHTRAFVAGSDIAGFALPELDDYADRRGPPDCRMHGQVEVALRACERYGSHSKDSATTAHSKVPLRTAHRSASRDITRHRGRDFYRAVDLDAADLARPSHRINLPSDVVCAVPEHV